MYDRVGLYRGKKSICRVNNSKKHLTKRFMGKQNRYCPIYGPKAGKQYYPDTDRGADA